MQQQERSRKMPAIPRYNMFTFVAAVDCWRVSHKLYWCSLYNIIEFVRIYLNVIEQRLPWSCMPGDPDETVPRKVGIRSMYAPQTVVQRKD